MQTNPISITHHILQRIPLSPYLVLVIPCQRGEEPLMRIQPGVKLLSAKSLISDNLLVEADCEYSVFLLDRQDLDDRQAMGIEIRLVDLQWRPRVVSNFRLQEMNRSLEY